LGVSITTSMVWAAWLVVVAVIVVALTEIMFAAEPPKVAEVLAPIKFVPMMVTKVPPAVEPEFGVTLVNVGLKMVVTVNPFARVPEGPPGFVTTTSHAPSVALARLKSQVIWVDDTTFTPVATISV